MLLNNFRFKKKKTYQKEKVSYIIVLFSMK